jgi:hypothetical protein
MPRRLKAIDRKRREKRAKRAERARINYSLLDF